MFIQQVLHVEGLGTHGTLEWPTVCGQVTLKLHLRRETVLTKQAPVVMKSKSDK